MRAISQKRIMYYENFAESCLCETCGRRTLSRKVARFNNASSDGTVEETIELSVVDDDLETTVGPRY